MATIDTMVTNISFMLEEFKGALSPERVLAAKAR
jgi:hypothetical protein